MSQKKTVLIIEDELKFAKMVKMRLEASGYMVTVAGDAYTGTQKIIQEDYDLIILDLMMPAGGGFSILERFRKLPARATTPVIIITGKTIDEEVQNMAEQYDVSAIFTKPYDSARFMEKIKTLIPMESESVPK
ncbi:response regulator [bacterium]|nr:response regulator [bacterium]